MAISVNWGTKVIYVPQDYLTSLGGSLYELDVDQFRLDLKDLEDNEDGIPFPDTHRHNTEVSLSGTTYARSVEIINGYVVTFEAGGYQVSCVGANHNIGDVMTNTTGPSLIIGNAAGLIVTSGGSGLTPEQEIELTTAATEATGAHTEATGAHSEAAAAAIDAATAASEATGAHSEATTAATQATTAATQSTTAATQATAAAADAAIAATQSTNAAVDAATAATQSTAAAVDAATAATQSTAAAIDAATAATQSTAAATDAATAASEATDAAIDAALARKLASNKAVVSLDDLTVTIYDDDEVTPLVVFDISADKRQRTPQ